MSSIRVERGGFAKDNTARTLFAWPLVCGSQRMVQGVSGSALNQGVSLVHFSAQRKRFLWDWGCVAGLIRGHSAGHGGYDGVFMISCCPKRIRLS